MTAQQSFCTVLLREDACAQQLCPDRCDCARQVPEGAISAPINTMATVARWKTPLNMAQAYHERSAFQ